MTATQHRFRQIFERAMFYAIQQHCPDAAYTHARQLAHLLRLTQREVHA